MEFSKHSILASTLRSNLVFIPHFNIQLMEKKFMM